MNVAVAENGKRRLSHVAYAWHYTDNTEANMTPEEFINDAIATGERAGVAALGRDQRLVYLISEAECLSDMEGIGSFFEKYSPAWLAETAAAFEAVGAGEIAAELRSVPSGLPAADPGLDRLNSLVTTRAGYDFEAIRRIVAKRLRSETA